MRRKDFFFFFLIIFVLVNIQAQNKKHLEAKFKNPPDEYKPLCLWYWLSGEISKEGITKDLEGMKAAGIGGAILFDLGQHISDEGKNILFSDEWNAFFTHTLKEADRLGLDIGVHNAPGWSGSGGPWVPVENSMKKMVCLTKEITGGRIINIELEKPKHYKDFYRDLFVYAIKGHNLKTISEKETSGGGFGADWIKQMDISVPDLSILNTEDIIDISNKFKGDSLVWNAPKGDWTVLRAGFTSTGQKNRVARQIFGSGLEPDKYDVLAIEKAFYDGFCGHALAMETKSGTNAFKDIFLDSWEVGYQNWSEVLPEEFKKRRGYNMNKYLPVLAGFIVDSPETSRRFLWDCRLTYGELIIDNYAKTMKRLSNKHGKRYMVEPYRQGGFHSFDYGLHTDVVVSEFWKGGHNFERIKSVASIAHAKGAKEHRAETFTTNYFNGGWRDHPWQYKMIGDKAFCSGVNSMAFHSYAHQPYPDNIVPGMSMGRWGAMISRKQTWWPMASAYMTYLARCQYLLRNGDFVGDVLFVTHEHLPNPDIKTYPELKTSGYDYDIISPKFFMENATIINGKVHLPGGTSYELVVFPNSKWVTPKFMESIDKTVRKGIQTIGYDYQKSPSLEGGAESDDLVKNISQSLILDTKNGKLPNYYLDKAPLDVLTELGIIKDFQVVNAIPSDAKINYIHHRVSGKNVYFIANESPKRMCGNFRFREGHGKPSLWNPMDGSINNNLVYSQYAGVTNVQLEMAPWQSLFVVIEPINNQEPHFTKLKSDKPTQESTLPEFKLYKVVRGKIFDPSPENNVDITSQLKPMIKDNALSVDSIPGEGKLAIAHYKINNEMMYYMRWANEGIHLDAGDAEATSLGAEVRHINGEIQLLTGESGNYTLKKSDGESLTVAIPSYKNELELNSPWKVSFQKGRGVSKESIILDELTNLSEHSDFNIRHFSGIIEYETVMKVPRKFIKNNACIKIEFENIANIASVQVNGIDCGIVWAKPYVVDVSKALKKGKNVFVIQVANSWSNRLIGDEYFPTELEQNAEGATVGPIPNWVREGKIDNRPQKKRVAFTSNRFYTKDDALPSSGLFGKVVLKKWVSQVID
ncbi:hypothetical protein E1J38_001335 [Seonamhaeicola sediminis]|uniref:Glycosyl hydrolases family 2 sugar binding domain-containing protein n=1 Tax=Seonamhaeicola sediminis TaxID=2528206 RepID=A0A562YHM6_9FLAO|nr:glycosyl hydrolase [Seonamhaeicola sediminis]TWO34525.1 hypothetical protein E1J38_001335 [Seonamhaeicola sediminis]